MQNFKAKKIKEKTPNSSVRSVAVCICCIVPQIRAFCCCYYLACINKYIYIQDLFDVLLLFLWLRTDQKSLDSAVLGSAVST